MCDRHRDVCTLPYSAQQAVLTNISAVLYVDRLTTTTNSVLFIPCIFIHSIFLKTSEVH